jgi:DNA-binding XRE family transcriptional regulator
VTLRRREAFEDNPHAYLPPGDLSMPRKHRFESKTLQFTYDRYVGRDRKRQAGFEEAWAGAEVACQIYEQRTRARLTQAQLAELVGTSTSAISRLEDADYRGHTLGVLRRIASALNQRVEVTFIPLRSRAVPRPTNRTNRRQVPPSSRSRKKSVA